MSQRTNSSFQSIVRVITAWTWTNLMPKTDKMPRKLNEFDEEKVLWSSIDFRPDLAFIFQNIYKLGRQGRVYIHTLFGIFCHLSRCRANTWGMRELSLAQFSSCWVWSRWREKKIQQSQSKSFARWYASIPMKNKSSEIG